MQGNDNDTQNNKEHSLLGIQVTPYLRYGSLPLNARVVQKSRSKKGKGREDTVHLYADRKFYSPPDPYLKQYWKCGWCNAFDGVLERPEAIAHLNQCPYYQENLAHIKRLRKKNNKEKKNDSSTKEDDDKEEKRMEVENTTTEPDTNTKANTNTSPSSSKLTPVAGEKIYFCSSCQQEILIRTPADILRHRKTCTKSS